MVPICQTGGAPGTDSTRKAPMCRDRSRVATFTLALGVMVAAALSCNDGSSGPSAADTVSILDNFFTPQTISVPRGTLVRWINSGSAVHDVTQYEGAFVSDAIGPGQTFEHTFAAEGIFEYACTRHAGMRGTVRVE